MLFQVCADQYGRFTVVEDGQPIPAGMKSFPCEGENKFHALGKMVFTGIMAVRFLDAEMSDDPDAAVAICNEMEAVVDEVCADDRDIIDVLHEMRFDK